MILVNLKRLTNWQVRKKRLASGKIKGSTWQYLGKNSEGYFSFEIEIMGKKRYFACKPVDVHEIYDIRELAECVYNNQSIFRDKNYEIGKEYTI